MTSRKKWKIRESAMFGKGWFHLARKRSISDTEKVKTWQLLSYIITAYCKIRKMKITSQNLSGLHDGQSKQLGLARSSNVDHSLDVSYTIGSKLGRSTMLPPCSVACSEACGPNGDGK